MGADYHARQIYDMQIRDVTTSEDKWKSILKLAGNLYRYEFDNILLIYAQRPQATLVADYDTWKKVDRYVMRGSKGIAIFPSRALSPHLPSIIICYQCCLRSLCIDKQNVIKLITVQISCKP